MVTVITNLLSAIPWIGRDLVEFEYHLLLNFYITLSFLPIIGSINKRGLRRKTCTSKDKEYTSNIPYSFLSMFMGLINNNGHIAIAKERTYIRIQLVINLQLKDIDLLKEVQSILKVGRINVYPTKNIARYIISRWD